MQNLSHVERRIIGAILDEAAARGLLVSVHDGDEWAVKPTADYAKARADVGATDQTTLRFRDPADRAADDPRPATLVGSVALIHGNGCDVIHDFTDAPSMRALLAPALALADEASR